MPLEPICVYIMDHGKEKMTSDTGERVRFHGHRKLAREILAKRQILLPSAFAQVDWINVNKLYMRSHGFSNFGQTGA